MTYKDIDKLTQGSYSKVFQNLDGEFVEIHAGSNEDGKLFRVKTYQNNGWIRTNVYYQDGSVDEMYRKDGA